MGIKIWQIIKKLTTLIRELLYSVEMVHFKKDHALIVVAV